jgi:hypothetical protein
MKLEIVISAHNEKLKWIPVDWYPKSMIYRCGDPIVSHNEKIFQNSYTMNMPHLNYGVNSESFSSDINKVKLILDLMLEYQNLFGQQKDGATYLQKNALNCENGRESEQWLNHIIWRYDNLADITVFLQGHPHDHCPDFINIINKLSEIDIGYFSFSTLPYTSNIIDFNRETNEGNYLLCGEFLQQIPKKIEKISWTPGAQFAISKQHIYRHPKEWYEKLQNLCRQTPRSGEIMERLWWNIFDCPNITEIQ